ncbi:Imm26 family immunity protein [Paenibacillus urinalis]|uniref:Imm26 family immunity protein n=1 Tax=Paenibacillus urinalis TaxID=521520 RepID=A0ABY7X6I5_9BACL|nr:Imm26 family immunity protein [Paenibacillus urinalis]WDH97756.1 Imm26 family immunity protein [Paenibacillus urinalis]WDI01431.1 Imm26 family immunity protein [Paenibacillus urinalis]
MRKKKVNIGDVFVIPIKENRYGYGQVVLFGSFFKIFIAFDFITDEKITDIKEILSKDIIILIRSNLVFIEDGYWTILGNAELPVDLALPEYYIREGLDDSELVTAEEDYVRIATEEDLKKYSINATYTPGVLEDILNAIVDGEDWKEEYGDVVYKP